MAEFSVETLDQIIDAADGAVVVLDRNGRVVHASERIEALSDHVLADVADRPAQEVFPGLEICCSSPIENMLSGRETSPFETYYSSGKHILRLRITPVTGGVLLHFRPLTDIEKIDKLRADADLRLKAILENALDAIIVTDEIGTIQVFNPVAEHMFGYSAAEVIGRNVSMLMPEPHRSHHVEYMHAFTRSRQSAVIGRRRELAAIRKSGEVFPLELSASVADLGDKLFFFATMRDISERKRQEDQQILQEYFDPLTGLANRTLLLERLRQSLISAQKSNKMAAVLFLDLDRFKFVNDSIGHEAGDAVLRIVAQRLTTAVRSGDTVCRWGGSEFVVLMRDIVDPSHIARVSDRLQCTLSEPYVIDTKEFFSPVSIGISLFPRDAQDGETLLRHADTAMVQVKIEGGGIRYFSTQLHERVAERVAVENALRRSVDHLERSEFDLHYQAKADLATGGVVGMEALVRWTHPDIGRIPPDRFIPIAEETGLIVQIGDWVLRTACTDLRRWRSEGFSNLRVAVNLSPRQLHQERAVERIRAIIQAEGIDPALVELEITESFMIENLDETIGLLERLRDIGVSLAIDDFGTGYSSFSYLRRLPVDTIKVDRSFVSDVDTDGDAAAVTTAIIAMSKGLGLKVVAEGVEKLAHVKFLRERQCDEAQGYFLSKPLPAGQFEQFLHRNLPSPAEEMAEGTALRPLLASMFESSSSDS